MGTVRYRLYLVICKRNAGGGVCFMIEFLFSISTLFETYDGLYNIFHSFSEIVYYFAACHTTPIHTQSDTEHAIE